MSLFLSRAPLAPVRLEQLSHSSDTKGWPSSTGAKPEAVALLGEVLARIGGVEKPVIQLMPCSRLGSARQVAFDFSVAAAHHLGRTLLVSSTHMQNEDNTGARALSRRITELLGGQVSDVLADALVAELYHAPLPAGTVPGRASQMMETWFSSPRAFQMIVLDSPPIASDPSGLALAAVAAGCLLTVAAGVTRAEEVRTCERQLRSAGVLILGTVLHDAPAARMGILLDVRAAK